MAKWIGVDLDGTLAEYNGQLSGIGDPINPMMNRVKRWLSQGRKVRIVTARAGDPVQLELAKAWLKRHGLEGLPITNRKDFDMLQLWDDKARRVERNTGQPCKGCAGTGKHNAENHSERESILTDC